jgi:hypothetical protein
MDELNEQARAPHTQDLLIVHYKSHYTTGHSAELVPSLCVVDFGPAAARARFFVQDLRDRVAKAVARGGARRAPQVAS